MEISDAYKALLIQAKFQAVREARYLDEELEMLSFERDHPQEAQRAVAEFEYLNANAKKPKLVSLTPADVDRIVKNNKTIPLDTVELLRLEEAENEMLKRQAPQVDPSPHKP